MEASRTAVILLGYQNDFFATHGNLTHIFHENNSIEKVSANTHDLISALYKHPIVLMSTPYEFSEGQVELSNAKGFMKTIKNNHAFIIDSEGYNAPPFIAEFGQRIIPLPGRKSLNAFSYTELDAILKSRGIRNTVFVGAMAASCVDTTARAANELGFNSTILSDCTLSRTVFEHNFLCKDIFPLYADVMTKDEFLQELQIAA